MKFNQFFIILQTAHLLPLIIAGIRYLRMDRSYRPFILLLALGFLNETVNFFLIKQFGSNSVSFNVFHIIEFSLLLYQFKTWGFFKKIKIFYALQIGGLIAWLVENFLYSSIYFFNPYFRIFYAFIIELIIVNRIIYIVDEKTHITKNSKFLICIGLIIVFIYQMVYEGALMADPKLTASSSKMIIQTMGFTDVFVQLLYAWAFLVAPSRSDLLWRRKH